MEPAKDRFCSLPLLLFDIHKSDPPVCVFRPGSKNGIRNCASKISEGNCVMGRALFDSIRSIPEVRFDVREDAFALLDVFDELASHLLCVEHAIHYQSLRSQWIWEFGRRRIEILSELEKYYGRINHGDEDEDNSDDGEKSDTSLTQSLTITEFKKLCPEIKEEEVARKVTKKLEQNVGEQGKLTGCVYIISPNDTEFHGMLKIGCTKVHPEVSRFAPHNRCLGSFETIAVRPVTYAQRVEQLLLAEFSHARYSKKCRKCGRVHNEWLEIKVDVIVKSLDKWCDFFSKFSPYKKDGRLGTLAEEVILPPPVSREYFSPRSANSTPLKNTSSVKDSMGKGSRKKNSAKKAPAEKTPKKRTPSGKESTKGSGKKGSAKQPPTEKTPTKSTSSGILTETLLEIIQHRPSSPTSPSLSGLKDPTITTTVIQSSYEEDSEPEENEVDPAEFEPAPIVEWLTSRLRRLGLAK